MADYIARWQQSISGEHESEDSSLVANLFDSCDGLFVSILTALSRDKSIERSTLLSLERSRSYLVLWADGFGVSEGRFDRSLDKSYRARALTQKLLVSICRSLTKRLLHHVSSEIQAQLRSKVARTSQASERMSFLVHSGEPDDRDSDSDGESDADSDASDSEPEELEEIAEDLRTETQCLLDLGPRFEEEPVGPVVTENPVNPGPSISWDPSEHFSERIRKRYPDCDTTVARRLGKVSWNRLLRCQELKARNEQLRSVATGNKVAGTIVASTAFNDSGLGSSVSDPTHYEETIVSYHGPAGGSIRVPALPDEAKKGAPFPCVACGRMVNISNTSAWKKHLFLDLQSYICLHNECSFNETAFATKVQWIEHLSLDHNYSPKWAISECSICHEKVDTGKLSVTRHLSQHLEEISLIVLPTNAEELSASDDESDNVDLSIDHESTFSEVEWFKEQPVQMGLGEDDIDNEGHPRLSLADSGLTRYNRGIIPPYDLDHHEYVSNTLHPPGQSVDPQGAQDSTKKPFTEGTQNSTPDRMSDETPPPQTHNTTNRKLLSLEKALEEERREITLLLHNQKTSMSRKRPPRSNQTMKRPPLNPGVITSEGDNDEGRTAGIADGARSAEQLKSSIDEYRPREVGEVRYHRNDEPWEPTGLSSPLPNPESSSTARIHQPSSADEIEVSEAFHSNHQQGEARDQSNYPATSTYYPTSQHPQRTLPTTSSDMSQDLWFCLACDRQTDGAIYCSEACRLSDFEDTAWERISLKAESRAQSRKFASDFSESQSGKIERESTANITSNSTTDSLTRKIGEVEAKPETAALPADLPQQRPRRLYTGKPKVKTGCNNCKRRRIKCDEKRPSCTQCLRASKVCIGYPPPPRPRVFEEIRPALAAKSASEKPEARSPGSHIAMNTPANSPLDLPSSSSRQRPQPEPPKQELQCPLADCDFRPSGKLENHEAYLRKHMVNHGDQTYRCDQCPRVYSRADNREAHRRKAHAASNAAE
ncbi:hypothetical protein F5Y13DRAFT_202569 [Hypoxylon sp. FL1857]|nr:hypothetical protein F5Y13DRAFT_202569 [Hypoxylon sp. FL1857]